MLACPDNRTVSVLSWPYTVFHVVPLSVLTFAIGTSVGFFSREGVVCGLFAGLFLSISSSSSPKWARTCSRVMPFFFFVAGFGGSVQVRGLMGIFVWNYSFCLALHGINQSWGWRWSGRRTPGDYYLWVWKECVVGMSMERMCLLGMSMEDGVNNA